MINLLITDDQAITNAAIFTDNTTDTLARGVSEKVYPMIARANQ